VLSQLSYTPTKGASPYIKVWQRHKGEEAAATIDVI